MQLLLSLSEVVWVPQDPAGHIHKAGFRIFSIQLLMYVCMYVHMCASGVLIASHIKLIQNV